MRESRCNKRTYDRNSNNLVRPPQLELAPCPTPRSKSVVRDSSAQLIFVSSFEPERAELHLGVEKIE